MASAVAHIVLLAIAYAWRPTIPIPETPEVPSPDAITVQLVRLAPAAGRQAARLPLRLHRVPQAPSQAGPPIAPLPAAPAQPGPSTAPAATVGADLRAGLRRGAAGCANMAAVGMSRDERDGCNERLGRNATGEPFLPAAIGGRIRAYYDLVALAKAPDPQPVLRRRQVWGPGGVFSVDDRGETGHGPSIGCKIAFGVGKKPPKLPHALYLGPCYIEPPAGSLTPDVDITPP